MILITGATGGLGSAVASFLKEMKPQDTIAVMVRDSQHEKARELSKQGFEIRVGDYSDAVSLEAAFKGVDLLYFVSGNDMENRWQQHQNVVSAAKKASVNHIFYTSVSLKNLSPDSLLYPSMNDHLQTEQLILGSGLSYTFLRHNLYAEVVPLFLGAKEQLYERKSVFLPTGHGKAAFVLRDDLAEAGAKALINPSARINGAYDMNGEEGVTFAQIADDLSEIMGESIAYVSPNVDAFIASMKEFGVPEAYIGLMASFGVGISEGVFDAQSTDLSELLGRKPVPIKEFLVQVYA